MTTTNFNICADGELGIRAQSVLADLGLDMTTVINRFAGYVVDKGDLPLEMDESKTVQKKIPVSELYGCMEIWMADDFDEPLEEMREYTTAGLEFRLPPF